MPDCQNLHNLLTVASWHTSCTVKHSNSCAARQIDALHALVSSDLAQAAEHCEVAQVDQIVSLRSEALQLQESLRLALLDKAEGEGQLQILKDKIAAKNLEGERFVHA